MCRPMEPNPNSKIFMCPTVVNPGVKMSAASELGHTSERAVNRSASRIAGFVANDARGGATCCASRSGRARPGLRGKELLQYSPYGDVRVMQLPYSDVWTRHEGGREPDCTTRMASGNLSSS